MSGRRMKDMKDLVDDARAALDRAEAAEAQLAALREAYERLADAVAYERLTHDGDVADLPGPGALGRLGTAEQMARCALADADAAAASYRARVEAEALERTAELWLTSGDGNVRTSDRERMHNWLIRRANDIRAEAAKRAEKSK